MGLSGARGRAHRRHRAAARQPGAVRAARVGRSARRCRCRALGAAGAAALAGRLRACRGQRLPDVRQPARRAARQPRVRRQDGLLVAVAGCNAGAVPCARRARAARPRSRARRPRCRWGYGSPSSSAVAGSPTREASKEHDACNAVHLARRPSLPCALAALRPTTAGAASTRRGRSTSRARPRRSRGATRMSSSTSSVAPDLKLPADLAQRAVPAQSRAGRRRRAAGGGPAADAQGHASGRSSWRR